MKIDHLPPEYWAHHDPTFWQKLVRVLFARPGRWLMRYRGYGHEPRVPETGGFLLAPAPHGAFVDPFIWGLGQPRTQLRFMAKYQALEWPIAGRFIKRGGGFPVHRGGTRSAAETAGRQVDGGRPPARSAGGGARARFAAGPLSLPPRAAGTRGQ